MAEAGHWDRLLRFILNGCRGLDPIRFGQPGSYCEFPMNKFVECLKSDQPQYGLWSALCSANAAELCAGAGFDWMLFDAEHSPVELAEIISLLRAANGSASALAVRVPWNDMVMIKRVLDLGAQTLFVPFVQNADEAQAAVSACRYPPNGVRGVAGSTRATRYGRDGGYHANANANTCLIVQVETVEAVGRLEEIASVDGVNGVFIGPGDLSASMGHLGKPDHPEVQKILRDCADRLNALGVPGGIMAGDVEKSRRYAEMGYRFIAAGVDTALLTTATDALIAELRS